MGLDFAEAGGSPPFPSTIAALSPAADFILRLVAKLEATAHGGPILPDRQMLNVNFPVPYGAIGGVRHTRLGQQGDLRFFWVPAAPGLALVLVEPLAGPDPIGNADANAHRDGLISITTMDGDMTARIPARIKVVLRTRGLEP